MYSNSSQKDKKEERDGHKKGEKTGRGQNDVKEKPSDASLVAVPATTTEAPE